MYSVLEPLMCSPICLAAHSSPVSNICAWFRLLDINAKSSAKSASQITFAGCRLLLVLSRVNPRFCYFFGCLPHDIV